MSKIINDKFKNAISFQKVKDDIFFYNDCIIDLNKPIYDYNLFVKRELTEICEPLEKYLALYIGYLRIYSNNRYFILHDDTNFIEKFALHLEKDTIFCEQYLGSLNNKNEFIYTLWPNNPTDHPSMITHFNAGYWNGLDVFKKSEDYLELWWFSRKRTDHNYTNDKNFFLRNIETLTKFILHFNTYASQYLLSFPQNKLAIFKKGFDFSIVAYSPQEYDQVTSFLKTIANKHIQNNGKNYVISNRELECLKYLSLGMTMKGIAKEMKISPRTIESHIIHVKKKSGYKYRSDLIKLFQDNFLT